MRSVLSVDPCWPIVLAQLLNRSRGLRTPAADRAVLPAAYWLGSPLAATSWPDAAAEHHSLFGEIPEGNLLHRDGASGTSSVTA
jgi:hypothetical protein